LSLGVNPATPDTSEAPSEAPASPRADDEFERRYPALDWAHAMTLCLRCGWYGRRPDWRGHACDSDRLDGEQWVLL
jgi:hypothetical protein